MECDKPHVIINQPSFTHLNDKILMKQHHQQGETHPTPFATLRKSSAPLGGRIDISKTHRSQGLHRHVKNFLGGRKQDKSADWCCPSWKILKSTSLQAKGLQFCCRCFKKGSPQATIL